MTLSPAFKMAIRPFGDSALLVDIDAGSTDASSDIVMALNAQLSRQRTRGITQTTPSYNSLLVCFEPEQVQHSVPAERDPCHRRYHQRQRHTKGESVVFTGMLRSALRARLVPHWRRNYRKTGSPSLIAFALRNIACMRLVFFRALLTSGIFQTHCTATVCGIREQLCLRHRLPLPALKPAFIPSTRRADGGS